MSLVRHAAAGTIWLGMLTGAHGVLAADIMSPQTDIETSTPPQRKTRPLPDLQQIADLISRPQLWNGSENTTSDTKKRLKGKSGGVNTGSN